jgi:beta-galactosidase/beta-glucuronidase
MTSRRDFLTALSAASAAAMVPLAVTAEKTTAAAPSSVANQALEKGWQFRLDPHASGEAHELNTGDDGWHSIVVPHTWQIVDGSENYIGVAWYRTMIYAPAEWQESFVRVEFEAISHTAHVFLNGTPVGEHIGKAYTAFTCDLQPALRFAQLNTLLIRVDNTYSETMLPRMKSYDWASDGGIVRPVNLLVTPKVFIERIEIDAIPDIDQKKAEIKVRAVVRNTRADGQRAQLRASIQEQDADSDLRMMPSATASIGAGSTTMVELGSLQIDAPRLWHFDAPNLYQAKVTLAAAGQEHTYSDGFGIRKFEIRGAAFYLNGERVFLVGLERMAGSNPDYGMAEPATWIDANHRDMKELNCIFTRVHWAQDRRVLDYCDRHGILMQEEVPAWGPATFTNTENGVQQKLEENGIEQMREMITRDRNHPSIVSWGLCNEVNGKNPMSRQFAHAVSAEARRLDPNRLQTYASHSLANDPGADMAGDFDFISGNEYYGSWAPGGVAEVRAYVDRIRKAFPGKPVVISEYGWCECKPETSVGDTARVGIVNSHTEVFRDFPEVAGAIYFDYNDYRTLVGDKGLGAFKQRVHGVVDLYSNRKPSFDALRLQSSPIEQVTLSRAGNSCALSLKTRSALPAYTLRGYSIRWIVYGYDDLPMEGGLSMLPELNPGDQHSATIHFKTDPAKRMTVEILRPTGFSVTSAAV